MSLFRSKNDPQGDGGHPGGDVAAPPGRPVSEAAGESDALAQRLQRRLADLESEPHAFEQTGARPDGGSAGVDAPSPGGPATAADIVDLNDQLDLLRHQLEEAFAELEQRIEAAERRADAAEEAAATATARAADQADVTTARVRELSVTTERVSSQLAALTSEIGGDDMSDLRLALDRLRANRAQAADNAAALRKAVSRGHAGSAEAGGDRPTGSRQTAPGERPGSTPRPTTKGTDTTDHRLPTSTARRGPSTEGRETPSARDGGRSPQGLPTPPTTPAAPSARPSASAPVANPAPPTPARPSTPAADPTARGQGSDRPSVAAVTDPGPLSSVGGPGSRSTLEGPGRGGAPGAPPTATGDAVPAAPTLVIAAPTASTPAGPAGAGHSYRGSMATPTGPSATPGPADHQDAGHRPPSSVFTDAAPSPRAADRGRAELKSTLLSWPGGPEGPPNERSTGRRRSRGGDPDPDPDRL